LTVRRKALVILAAAAAMLGSLYAAADYVILSPFIRREHLKAQETLGVIRELFNDDLEKLDKGNSDLSVYDGTYDRHAQAEERLPALDAGRYFDRMAATTGY
jgi:sensor domain CHASE-containing protein